MDVVGVSSAVVSSVGAPAGSTVSAVSALLLVSTMTVGRSCGPVVGEASRRIDGLVTPNPRSQPPRFVGR